MQELWGIKIYQRVYKQKLSFVVYEKVADKE